MTLEDPVALKVQKKEGSSERLVLIAMVTARAVLAPVAERWEPPGLFSSSWSNLVGGWCVRHYRRYRRAPGPAITNYFEEWAEAGRDRETVGLVESFLGSLSDEAERMKKTMAPEHLIDVAGRLFERIRLADVAAKLTGYLESGDVDRARSVVEKTRPIQIGLGSGVDFLAADDAVAAAFSTQAESLIDYPGAAGNFFGTTFCRDSFVAFVAKNKVGKSFIAQDLAVRATEQGRRVAYIEAGDHSQDQLYRRLASRLAGRPYKTCRYQYPVSMESCGEKKEPVLKTESRAARRPMTGDEAVVALKALREKVGSDKLKVSSHASGSVSASGIEIILEGWSRDGWYPDVCVIDYADLLAPVDPREDARDRINTNWIRMRAISQRYRCCVVTMTQCDTDGYDTWVLTRSNFSGDRRKNDHVTAMIGINQTAKEKDKGLYRFNYVNGRDLEFSERKCLWVASCLAECNPIVLSTF